MSAAGSNPRYPELAGRRAVVVGSGPVAIQIGRAFSENGAATTLVIPGDADNLGGILASHADLGVPARLRAALDRAIGDAPVDILVSATEGSPGPRALTAISDEQWHRSLDEILGSAFTAAVTVVARMQTAGRGCIVLVGSQLAMAPPWASAADYVAAKGGLVGLARHLAREYGGDGIRTNTVLPGVDEAEWATIAGSEAAEGYFEAIPLGRLTQPSDPAELVLFLATDGASYINGATLLCNGGRSM